MSTNSNPLNILYIGDAVGKAGRKAISALVPQLREELALDAVFLNAENLAHGRGISTNTIQEVLDAGVDFCTSGNHIWDNAEGVTYLQQPTSKVLRPANFAADKPGKGYAIITINNYRILLINLLGQVFMSQTVENPFHALTQILDSITENYDVAIVDFHAEATSEKQGLAWSVDGKVSAIVGTHTHVPTADLRILPQGTGLVCDLGFVGAADSILGFAPTEVLDRFLNTSSVPLHPVENGKVLFNSVLIKINPTTKLPVTLQRIDREILV